jgi:CRISPR-associated protein Cas2
VNYMIFYDIADAKRLRRVERAVSAMGHRLHYSAFVCELDDDEIELLQRKLSKLINISEDSIRYLPLCEQDRLRSIHLGSSSLPAIDSCWVV